MLHGDGGPPPAKRARQDSSEDAAFAAAAERAAELGVLKAELVRKLSSAAPLWGVDEQALQLARVLDRSLDDASNEVVLLAGHRGSGKTATLEQVLAASGADSDAGAGSSSSSSSGSSSSSSANASSSASSGAGASSRGSRFRIVRLHGQLHQKMDPNNNSDATRLNCCLKTFFPAYASGWHNSKDSVRAAGIANRNTLVRVVPKDANGLIRPDLAMNSTCSQVVLRKTRELVYNYIGQGPVEGVTSAKQETYVEFASREMENKLSPNSFGVATDFVSQTWGDHFADTVDALLPSDIELYNSFFFDGDKTSPSFFGVFQCGLSAYGLGALGLLLSYLLLWPMCWYMTPDRVRSHYLRPRWWTPRSLRTLANEGRYYWIDILAKNQHIVNSTGTSVELQRCVRGCERTKLVCTPYDEPSSLKRVWCLFEVTRMHNHHTAISITLAYTAATTRTATGTIKMFKCYARCAVSLTLNTSLPHRPRSTALGAFSRRWTTRSAPTQSFLRATRSSKGSGSGRRQDGHPCAATSCGR